MIGWNLLCALVVIGSAYLWKEEAFRRGYRHGQNSLRGKLTKAHSRNDWLWHKYKAEVGQLKQQLLAARNRLTPEQWTEITQERARPEDRRLRRRSSNVNPSAYTIRIDTTEALGVLEYVATAEELGRSCLGYGNTPEEARAHLLEDIADYLVDADRLNVVPPPPRGRE